MIFNIEWAPLFSTIHIQIKNIIYTSSAEVTWLLALYHYMCVFKKNSRENRPTDQMTNQASISNVLDWNEHTMLLQNGKLTKNIGLHKCIAFCIF